MAVSVTVPSGCVDMEVIRRSAESELVGFLAEQKRLAGAHGLPGDVVQVLEGFICGGGKRIRPVLCGVGWFAGGGEGIPDRVARVGAALEVFHAFALIHDDVMDSSDMRRGRPTVHRTFATLHKGGRSGGSAERLGYSAAILAGDLALVWSDRLLHTSGMPPARLVEVLQLVDEMRSELMFGQYLDITSTGRPTEDVDQALRIVQYKTARYTLEWPLLIGAALAGAPKTVRDSLSAYARPLGEAFQLRDDLLGVFGVPHQTGKSRLDDLRDGKHTALMAVALQRADTDQRRILDALVGRPDLDDDGAAKIRKIMVATGARTAVEDLIRSRWQQASTAVERGAFPWAAAAALRQISETVTVRAS